VLFRVASLAVELVPLLLISRHTTRAAN